MKKALAGLVLALALVACSSPNYAPIDTVMDRNPTLVQQVCDGRAEALAYGFDDDQIFEEMVNQGAFWSFPVSLGLSDRQIYDRIVSRC